VDPGTERAVQFAARHDVGAIVLIGKDAKNGERGVRLDREHQLLARDFAECGAKSLRRAAQSVGRIDIGWGANGRRNRGERNRFGVHFAAEQMKRGHKAYPWMRG
jgi:hypothetical protein